MTIPDLNALITYTTDLIDVMLPFLVFTMGLIVGLHFVKHLIPLLTPLVGRHDELDTYWYNQCAVLSEQRDALVDQRTQRDALFLAYGIIVTMTVAALILGGIVCSKRRVKVA